jgi:hypothetical protein
MIGKSYHLLFACFQVCRQDMPELGDQPLLLALAHCMDLFGTHFT